MTEATVVSEQVASSDLIASPVGDSSGTGAEMPHGFALDEVLSDVREDQKTNKGAPCYSALKSRHESSQTSTLTTGTSQTSFDYQSDSRLGNRKSRKLTCRHYSVTPEESMRGLSDISESSSHDEESYDSGANDLKYLAGKTSKPYNLRSQKFYSEKDFEAMKETINTHQIVLMSRVVDTLSNFEKTRLEEDLFCDYIKRRLRDLRPVEKRAVMFKLHQVLATDLDNCHESKHGEGFAELHKGLNNHGRIGEYKGNAKKNHGNGGSSPLEVVQPDKLENGQIVSKV